MSKSALTVQTVADPVCRMSDTGNNQFALREITTGQRGEQYYTALSGLSFGERVARNIHDSEAELRQSLGRQYGTTSPSASLGGTPQFRWIYAEHDKHAWPG